MQARLNKLANGMNLNTNIMSEKGQRFVFQLIDADTDEVVIESAGRTVLLAIENMVNAIKRSES